MFRNPHAQQLSLSLKGLLSARDTQLQMCDSSTNDIGQEAVGSCMQWELINHVREANGVLVDATFRQMRRNRVPVKMTSDELELMFEATLFALLGLYGHYDAICTTTLPEYHDMPSDNVAMVAIHQLAYVQKIARMPLDFVTICTVGQHERGMQRMRWAIDEAQRAMSQLCLALWKIGQQGLLSLHL